MLCLAVMLVKIVQTECKALLSLNYRTTRTGLLLAPRPRALNGLSHGHLVFRPYYMGALLFAGHGGGGILERRPLRSGPGDCTHCG